VIDCFEEMKPSLGEILSDSSNTFEEIVADQDSPACPWMRGPPTHPKVLFIKVIEDLSIKSLNFGNIDTDCKRKG